MGTTEWRLNLSLLVYFLDDIFVLARNAANLQFNMNILHEKLKKIGVLINGFEIKNYVDLVQQG